MPADVTQTIDELQRVIHEFKAQNDARWAALEKRGHASGEQEQLVERLNARITELEQQVKATDTKGGRPGSTARSDEEEQSEQHAKAFDRYMRKGDTSELERLRVRAVNVGTEAEGGYAVPEDLDRAVLERERKNSPMRDLCQAITVSGETYEKIVNLGGAASGWVGETAARPETTAPGLASIKPFFGEVYANPATTQKALDDMMFDVEEWLISEVSQKFAEDENAAFTSGNGTAKPKGVLGYTLAATADAARTFGQIQKVHSGVAGTFVPDKLIDLIHSMKRGHRANAVWVMNTLAVAAVRKLKDSDGNYLWRPGIQAGQLEELLGYPIVENDDMPDPAADANVAIFGDFKRGYLIADVKGFRVLRDPYTNKPYVHFYSTKRVGGGVVEDRAFKVYTLSV